jgi:predicted S18 family serine protease
MACEQEQQDLNAAWQTRLQREAEMRFIYERMAAASTTRDEAYRERDRAVLASREADEIARLAQVQVDKADAIHEYLEQLHPVWQQAYNDSVDEHNAALEAYNTCVANVPPPPNEV